MSKKRLVVAVVGATGAVGRKCAEYFKSGVFRWQGGPLASARSAGSGVEFAGQNHEVECLEESSFAGVDLALFSAGASVSEQFGPIAAEAGTVVVDNSYVFRMDPAVPLVVPEVNPRPSTTPLYCKPNCSTIQMVAALEPLHKIAGLSRVVVSTYQSASGAGRGGMDELRDQTIALLNFRDPRSTPLPKTGFRQYSSHRSVRRRRLHPRRTEMMFCPKDYGSSRITGVRNLCTGTGLRRSCDERKYGILQTDQCWGRT